jgi:hypothetical protein
MPINNPGMIAEELGEIKNEFEGLLEQVKGLLRGTGMIGRRAEVYWIAHIEGALEGRGSMVTMEETINELNAANSPGEEDEGGMPMSHRASRSRKTAKMDIMTGFTGKKAPDPDLGLKGNGYFEKWTTVALPDTGKNTAIDDEQQKSGGGAPATVIPGAPLKTPMEAQDVTRPKLRESPEASRRKAAVLRKVASEIRRLDPITARRLMAAADELSYDALSTASLPEAGDEANEVDDYQDQFGHGTLQFFGTDPAKSTSLTRESSRGRRTAAEDFTRCEISFKHPGGNWEKEICTSKDKYDKKMKELKKDGAEIKVRHFDNGDRETNLQYARRGGSRRRVAVGGGTDTPDEAIERTNRGREQGNALNRAFVEAAKKALQMGDSPERAMERVSLFKNKVPGGEYASPELIESAVKQAQYEMRGRGSVGASRRRSAGEGKGIKDIDWTNTLKLVDSALQGKYDRGAVAHILKSDFDRSMALLKGGQGGQNGEMVPVDQGQHATASSRNRRARTEGDAPLKPEPTVGDQDGPGADGAGGFYKESKAPLQETMTAQDVERPKLRENPEAGRLAYLWDALRSELIRQASGSGKWNSGRYALEARDYGDSVEIQASVVDRENIPMPVGSILFSRINDSPKGRYATVEVNDGILENRTTEFTLQRPRQASMIAKRLVGGVVQASKDLIDGITV